MTDNENMRRSVEAPIATRMALKDVSAADFTVADASIDAVLRRHVKQEYDTDDPAWLEHETKEISTRRLGIRRWLRRIMMRGRNAREQAEVRSSYEEHWNNAPTADHIASMDDRMLAVRWHRRGMLVAPQALRQVHMLYLMRAIQMVQPRRVLEVGCGNGNVVLTLAARFPGIAFAGIELTISGIAAAREVQMLPELPASMVDGSPEPLLDMTAHRTVNLQRGDAGELPFPDRSYDFVYTRLALEQMEQIREKALGEITRVAGNAVVLIEPWRDYNLTDPGHAYIRRMGYFTGKAMDLEKYGFKVVMSTEDIPQKVQFNAGPVVAVRAREI